MWKSAPWRTLFFKKLLRTAEATVFYRPQRRDGFEKEMEASIIGYVVGFLLSFIFVIRSADYAIEYATRLARTVGVSEFVISFLLIGLVSALPEGSIAIAAAVDGEPAIAATSLLASNIGDLLFVFGVVALFASGLRITTPVIKRELVYLLVLSLPFLLGFDGVITRVEGGVLLVTGLVFLGSVASDHAVFRTRVKREHVLSMIKVVVLLLVSLLVMMVSASFTVSFVSLIAESVSVSPTLIAVFIIGIGTCLPELLFTIRTLQKNRHDLALGNILGVVIIDGTIMLGIAALITPLSMTVAALQTLGFFTLLGAGVLFYFLKVHRKIEWWEGLVLLMIYSVFSFTQIVLH
jgi:cation:H+ antiporter